MHTTNTKPQKSLKLKNEPKPTKPKVQVSRQVSRKKRRVNLRKHNSSLLVWMRKPMPEDDAEIFEDMNGVWIKIKRGDSLPSLVYHAGQNMESMFEYLNSKHETVTSKKEGTDA